jgi:hypothetical protein
MFPLYLISEKGMHPSWANALIGLTRLPPMATLLVSGWITDRWGPEKALMTILFANGIAIAEGTEEDRVAVALSDCNPVFFEVFRKDVG